MKIIKLNAIESTNSFLKELAQKSTLENFLVVYTDNQINGRGQQGSTWLSKPFKNLTFSMFIRFKNLPITHQKYLNYAVSLAIYDVLFSKGLSKLFIKWPNDIMSANQKICGILIENTFTNSKVKNSVIGIGLNVNQIDFSSLSKKVTSLQIETKKEYSLELLLKEIVNQIKEKIALLNSKEYCFLENRYLNFLYKKNIPTMFKDSKNVLFIGIIKGVSSNGNLKVELENNVIKEFGLKEISFA